MIEVFDRDGVLKATYMEDDYIPEFTILAMIKAGYKVKKDGKKWRKGAEKERGRQC